QILIPQRIVWGEDGRRRGQKDENQEDRKANGALRTAAIRLKKQPGPLERAPLDAARRTGQDVGEPVCLTLHARRGGSGPSRARPPSSRRLPTVHALHLTLMRGSTTLYSKSAKKLQPKTINPI